MRTFYVQYQCGEGRCHARVVTSHDKKGFPTECEDGMHRCAGVACGSQGAPAPAPPPVELGAAPRRSSKGGTKTKKPRLEVLDN
eukprot:10453478-Karenia_brevis.AAC.1